MQHLFYHVFIGWNVGIEWNHRDKSGEMRFPARSIQLPTLWWTGASPQRLSWKFITFGVRPSYSQAGAVQMRLSGLREENNSNWDGARGLSEHA